MSKRLVEPIAEAVVESRENIVESLQEMLAESIQQMRKHIPPSLLSKLVHSLKPHPILLKY